MLSGLTIIDYLAVAIAIGMYFFLYKTVLGFRLRAVGINEEAAKSLGTPVERYQFLTITLSGILSGLGGVLLSMSTVTLFIQVGINEEAAKSLGTPVERYQFLTITLSGILSGLGGVLLSMSTVTLFIQDITSGRGYIALAANNLGQSHPLGVLVSSVFFGVSQAIGNALQNTSLKTQMTASLPYIATIVALILFSVHANRKKKRR